MGKESWAPKEEVVGPILGKWWSRALDPASGTEKWRFSCARLAGFPSRARICGRGQVYLEGGWLQFFPCVLPCAQGLSHLQN